EFQANCFRLELLLHVAASQCSGTKKVTARQISQWLNGPLGVLRIAGIEDPAEDVFTLNVICSRGNHLVLGGMWEAADYATSLLLQSIENTQRTEYVSWLNSAYALLAISDFLLRRAKLSRWESRPTRPPQEPIILSSDAPLARWRDRLVFT